ncbi:MAG: TatD family hydrolase [Microthrixaceae bacterium]
MSDAADPDTLRWIDNHCHLDIDGDRSGAALDAQLNTARDAGVVGVVCVGVDVESSRRCLDLASTYDAVWATAGVHPHEASGGIDGLDELLRGASGPSARPVAVGECGLDHHYDHSEPGDQREVFVRQIALANELALPLVIHTREAWDETFEILDAEGTPQRTVFHCFTGGPVEASECLDRGAMLSISGIVTFGSADDLRDAVTATPLDHLMVETDAPFLTPVPHRGKPNTPAWVPLVGAAVARCKGVTLAEVARATTANATEFYGLDPIGR